MSRGRKQSVECPVCAGKRRVSVFNAVFGVEVQSDLANAKVKVWHNDPRSMSMRCPLCYGSGRVSKELYSAFFLNYGDTLDCVWYKAVNVFRCWFNSVSANEIREK
jgi:hypothetical protein